MSDYLFALAAFYCRCYEITRKAAYKMQRWERRRAIMKEAAALERPAYLSKHGKFQQLMRGSAS